MNITILLAIACGLIFFTLCSGDDTEMELRGAQRRAQENEGGKKKMLGAMWDAIFSYADDLKERKEFEKLEAVKEVERLLIQAFDDTEACKARVEMKPRNALEEVVISIPGIEVFRDPTDKQIFYEMDGRHYDKPVEVLNELINYRQNGRKQAMRIVKDEAFRYIKNAVKLLRVNTLDEEKSKTVIRKDRPDQVE